MTNEEINMINSMTTDLKIYTWNESRFPDTLSCWDKWEYFKKFIFETMPDCDTILCTYDISTMLYFASEVSFISPKDLVFEDGICFRGFLKKAKVFVSKDLTEDQFILVNTKTGESKLGMVTH